MASIIITGGGTAGHTNPGIAVAQALVKAGVSVDDVHFVGASRGSEGELVPGAGFSIDLLPGRGIKRSLSVDNIGSAFGLMSALGEALSILKRRKPQVVMCLGGYAAFAVSAASIIRRVPLVVSEQNARASAVNRMFGRWAKVCALPFPETDLPRGRLTGNPIREAVVSAVTEMTPSQARAKVSARSGLGLEGRVLLAVWAGSLGATKINDATKQLAHLWAERDDVAIYHVVGKRDFSDFAKAPSEVSNPNYVTVEYENDMPSLLVAADLAVTRSGASTISELSVAGLPAVLVPLPYAPRDHQRANSKELVDVGGAFMINDEDLTASSLAGVLEPMIANSSSRDKMAAASKSVARPNAASEVAALLLEMALPGEKVA